MSGDPLRTIDAVRSALERGEATPEELLSLAAERHEASDEGEAPLRAFLSARNGDGDDASGGARRSGSAAPAPEGASAPERAGPDVSSDALRGVPIAVKDNLCTVGLPTTCGSRILERYRSPFAATAVRRLEAAGGRVYGKTNLDEFAMGSSTENSAFGPTRNPVDRSRVPGGSSGGSAAAVAAGIVPVALGSSTGGSVRQPAAFCGIVGIKPTYGRVSRYGLVAFASSLDQVGVLSRTVRDGARVLEVIAGRDARDATSRDRSLPRADALGEHDLSQAVVGVPTEYLDPALDAGIRERVEAALEVIAETGARVTEVSLPYTSHALPCYYVLAPAEASSNLARYDGVRYGSRPDEAEDTGELMRGTRGEGFGAEVKRRIMIGTYALSAGYYEAYYLRARGVRNAIAADFARVFEEVDAIFAPTTPTTAFRLGEKTRDPYEMYLADAYTVSANLAGIPAVSLPIGDHEGLPVGGQLMCPHWEEERMLGFAHHLESLLSYRHPLDGDAS